MILEIALEDANIDTLEYDSILKYLYNFNTFFSKFPFDYKQIKKMLIKVNYYKWRRINNLLILILIDI